MIKLIEALFLTYLVLFSFGQLTRVPLNFIGPEVHFYMADAVLLLLLIAWGIWRFRLKKKKYRLPPLALPIFLFSAISLLSLGLASPLLSSREVVVAGLYLIRWLAYAGLYLVIFDIKKHFGELKWNSLLRFLLVIGVTVAVFGLIQYLLWPNLRPLQVLEWDPHYYRVVSTFLDPGFTGMILVLALILVVVSYINISYTKNEQWWLVFSGAVVYLALALTYSRASYLAYVVGMGVIAWVKKAPKFFLAILLLGMVTLLILPRPAGEGGKLGRRYSVEARIESWQHALTIARDNPFLGVGFNAYRYAQRDYGFLEKDKWQASHSGAGADSSLLFVLATTGIFGFIAYLWLWGKIVQTKNLVILASAAALLSHSFFLNSLFYPWVMAWMWILLGSSSSRKTS